LEYNNTLVNLSLPLAIMNSIFHAVSFKSCGFILTSITHFHMATIFIIMIVGLIGSSPGSTGSGIKTTTFAIFLSIIKSTIKERPAVEAFEREIPSDQVYKTVSIIALSAGWILCATFCLLITEHSWKFIDVFFETVSSFSNVGFSLKGSHNLSFLGKILIIITMFIGRIGSLTFILGLKFKTRTEVIEFTYPEERVMLG
jgi:trk system potassium uptake protein TrkH